MTLRCALHARYSSDQQRAASIEDQFRVCREHAGREGWKIAGAYRDAAISGDSVILRPGIQGLLEDARRGLFEVVVAEALDRVSRDQADVAILYKHLRFAGVMIVTLSELSAVGSARMRRVRRFLHQARPGMSVSVVARAR